MPLISAILTAAGESTRMGRPKPLLPWHGVPLVEYQTAALVDAARDSILAKYDVTDQDLLDFVDSHGADVEFMRDLWSEIETRLSERLEQNARDDEIDGNDESDSANGNNGAEEIQDGDAGISP